MNDTTRRHVLTVLDAQRDELLYHVTEALIYRMPLLGMPAEASNLPERHRENMEHTARRFHEILQAGADIAWDLVAADFAWAGRKLGSMGITWEHQEILIDIYFEAAGNLHPWNADEQATLASMAIHLREVARPAYEHEAGVSS